MLKILAVSDEVAPVIESPTITERFGDCDVVLSCGDLPYTYLEYISTMLPLPCYYIHGNHDRDQHLSGGRILREPGGWYNIDRQTVTVKGWIIGGLEGSIRYRPDAPFQYTEPEMRRKINRMVLSLMWNRVFLGRYIDILITHAPPCGIHDGEDACHTGFDAYLTFMQRFQPRYLLHGHMHRINIERWHTTYEDTEVINVFPYRRIEVRADDEPEPEDDDA